MKKKLSVLFELIILFFMIVPITVSAYEGESIITVEAVQSNGEVYIHGTATDGVEVPALAVTVAVYKESKTDLVAMKTVQTNSVGELSVPNDSGVSIKIREYATSLKLPEGNYLIKVANYDGGHFAETMVTESKKSEEGLTSNEETAYSEEVAPEKTQKEITSLENPITTDNIIKIVAIFLIAVFVLVALIIINKRFKKIKQ